LAIAYFDCFSGIGGDMCLGALADAGLPPGELEAELAKLPVAGSFRLHFERVRRGFLAATRVRVEVATPQPYRRLEEIFRLLEESRLPPEVVSQSKEVFRRLVAAEARVHGIAPEEAHLHEAGAVDALVDVVGTVAGLRLLGVEEVWASPLPCPRGWVEASHGVLPLPAPAALELLRGVPVYGVEEEQELVTPTGAALLVSLARGFGPLPPMRLSRVGYGAGSRSLARTNVLRLLIGERERPSGSFSTDRVAVLEAAVDDMNPEFYPYLAERLFEEGALDVYWTPVQMKKGRPGVLASVLVPPDKVSRAAEVLFAESTTLGLRWRLEERLIQAREWITVTVGGEEIRVKCGLGAGGAEEEAILQLAPEYEDCRRAARNLGWPLKKVYLMAQEEARRRREGG
jgi:uncharacterized protein (TIGR00299 family) protein